MANPVNVFDFTNEDLATFLAKSVSDGTYNNVFGTLKVDQTGEDAAATQIIEKIGQLWGNALDDFVLSGYPHIRNVALGNGGLLHTTGAAKTGAYTALAGELVRYDATGGTFTVDVPASPADNTRFGIVEIGDDGTQITVDAGADTVIGPGGTSGTTLLLGSELTALIWEFSADDSTWSLVSEAGAVGGGGSVSHASTTGQTANDHHAQLHAPAHAKASGDPLTVESLATLTTELARGLKPDGAGGLAFGPILDAQPGTFSTGIVFHADVGNTASYAAGQTTTLLDVVAGAVGTTTSTNLAGGRLNFDGADSLVNFGPVSAAVAGVFDDHANAFIEIWCFIESDGEGNLGVLIDAGYGGDGKNYLLQVSDESGGFVKLKLTHAFTDTDGIWTTTDAVVPINEPVCIGFQYHNDNVANNPNFVLNGTSITGGVTEDQTPVGTADTDTAADLVLGNHADASATFDGWIEVVSMWNTNIVLTEFKLDSYSAKAARFGHYEKPFQTDFAEANQGNGVGAVNTNIIRFTTRGNSPDGNITWVDDSDDGTHGVIGGDSAGTYRITFNGTTVGATTKDLAICSAGSLSNTFAAAHIKAIQTFPSVTSGSMSCDIPLAANALIWLMRSGGPTTVSATDFLSRFTILKISDVGP